MTVGKATVQSPGYNALRFASSRNRSASKAPACTNISRPRATSAPLSPSLDREGAANLAELLATSEDATWCLDEYTKIFRSALANDNRMCLCGIMSAELDDLLAEVNW